jgi:hypothetical protein
MPSNDKRYGTLSQGNRPPGAAITRGASSSDRHYSRADVHLLEGGQHYDLPGHTREQVISDVLSQYERHIHLLHLARPIHG